MKAQLFALIQVGAIHNCLRAVSLPRKVSTMYINYGLCMILTGEASILKDNVCKLTITFCYLRKRVCVFFIVHMLATIARTVWLLQPHRLFLITNGSFIAQL